MESAPKRLLLQQRFVDEFRPRRTGPSLIQLLAHHTRTRRKRKLKRIMLLVEPGQGMPTEA
jgi:hypothetical protein